MATVGFIGFGIMGAPMATNLSKAGFDVVGFSRTISRVEELAGRGITVAGSVAEVAAAADVVVTMLPDSPDVSSVVLGDDGVLAHARSGLLFIDMSTIRPDVSVRIAERAAEQGIEALDAPVSGGEAGAVEGSLSIMVGGDAGAFERAKPFFAAMGETIVHVGPAGSGQTVKAANQLIVAANLQGLAEAVVFLEAHGVDLGSAIEVLGGGLAGSTVLRRKSENMLGRSFAPGFRLDLFHKDMGIVQAAAREKGVTTLLGALVAQIIGSLVTQGDGGLDHSAMIKVVDRLSG
ncbi:MAG: 2-hydroxy-3-oxopropionate reductase [Acidimicrobiaceae bacterium]|nr:2-hydroxy-3-oxopropionate reductase [Acidimicrobiaceae bacterium]MBO0747581.1 2-hydroxy-3-oxopropionate reductase [Acidimicrobiaceae bacterium]